MSAADNLLDSLKELLQAGNPGLVTQDDLRRVEDRLQELEELVDQIESKLEAAENSKQDAQD